jgi:hypothetical protein
MDLKTGNQNQRRVSVGDEASRLKTALISPCSTSSDESIVFEDQRSNEKGWGSDGCGYLRHPTLQVAQKCFDVDWFCLGAPDHCCIESKQIIRTLFTESSDTTQ